MILSYKILVLLFVLIAQAASATEFEPANLKDSKMSLHNLIKFPKKYLKSDEDINLVIRCDAFVAGTGKISSNFCFEGSKRDYLFSSAVNRAAKKAVLNPGRVDGTAREVYFQYYVVFMKAGKQSTIDVIPNSGLQVEEYGFDYTSPQRFRESSAKFAAACGVNKDITVNAVVSAQGQATGVEVLGKDLGERCEDYMEENFKQQQFIPAMVKGEAVNAFYSEKIFDNMRTQ